MKKQPGKPTVQRHLNLTINDRGLVILPQYPHLGASPDGYVKCHCCGSGVIEIKCPFSCKDRSFLVKRGFVWRDLKMIVSF